ncbi:MAG: hypothetical protein ABI409_19775 [Ramlibacter sp.]
MLRLKPLRLCVAVAEAHDPLADGEATVLAAVVEHWDLHCELLDPAQGSPCHVEPRRVAQQDTLFEHRILGDGPDTSMMAVPVPDASWFVKSRTNKA